jgi:hypothetical protein
MDRKCGFCGRKLKIKTSELWRETGKGKGVWIDCPGCGASNHLKFNKRGRLKKQTVHKQKK